jgi:hypothetical protein
MFVIPSLSSLSYRGFGDQKNENSYAIKQRGLKMRDPTPRAFPGLHTGAGAIVDLWWTRGVRCPEVHTRARLAHAPTRSAESAVVRTISRAP